MKGQVEKCDFYMLWNFTFNFFLLNNLLYILKQNILSTNDLKEM